MRKTGCVAPNTGASSGAGTGALAGAEGLRAPRRGARDWAAFAALMAASCFVFFWNLTASGYANEFYSAAAQAGSQDWEAFFWGSLDAGNAITVDKPPASIWLMALSVRLLGLSSFAILLPQALMGVATTWLLYACTRRYWGNAAGVVAGAVFITTPVAALMFRFNNPDALLVFLLVAASACVLRGLEKDAGRGAARRRSAWFALAGLLVGFGFLTKQFQALLVLPGFALAMFALSPTRVARRFVDAAVALAAMVVGAGWWVLAGVLVPSGSRPYFGGSQSDSFIELTFSYNGLGRLTGDETGSVVGGGAGGYGGGGAQGGMWGETGPLRLFGSDFADQISWLVLLAVLGVVLGLVAARALGKGDVCRRMRNASLAVFAAWLFVTWGVFSLMAGIFHQYYTVALAPAIAVLVAVCVAAAWELRGRVWVQAVSGVAVAAGAVWAFALVRSSGWCEPLAWGILVCGTAGPAVALAWLLFRQLGARAGGVARGEGGACPVVAPAPGSARAGTGCLHPALVVAAALSAAALLAAPVAWTGATIATGHTGSIVAAGPSGGMGGGGQPGGGSGGGPGQQDDGADGASTADGGSGDAASEGASSGGAAPAGLGGEAGGGSGDGAQGGGGQGGGQPGGSQGGGGLLGGGQADDELVELLRDNASGYRWAAATTGSQNAASYQLASELPVMAIGGFNGSDPAPTLDEFKSYVEQGLVRYYIASGGMGGQQMGGSDAASQIEQWVAANFTAQAVGNTTVYDLALGTGSGN